jgi:hypothetical protein
VCAPGRGGRSFEKSVAGRCVWFVECDSPCWASMKKYSRSTHCTHEEDGAEAPVLRCIFLELTRPGLPGPTTSQNLCSHHIHRNASSVKRGAIRQHSTACKVKVPTTAAPYGLLTGEALTWELWSRYLVQHQNLCA